MELEQRLKARNTETEESLKRRLLIAKSELEYGMLYTIRTINTIKKLFKIHTHV